MTSSHNSHRSRWAKASPLFSVVALAGGIVVLFFRATLGPMTTVLLALVVMPLGFWASLKASLYPRVYRGKIWAMAGLLLSFMGFSDAVGQWAYQQAWRRAFRLSGGETIFENREKGWKIRYPRQWVAFSMKTGKVSSSFFKPDRSTPAIEFSITHRPETRGTDLDAVVQSFLLDLPKSGRTQILSQGPVRYPKYQRAYQVDYEDPSQAIALRHRLVFIANAEGLTVLSVAAVPHWFERLTADANRFLFSFEPLG